MLSIITPVRNGEKFIRSNIESILDLRIPYEHIVVDGNSTDNTIKIVHEYPHIRVVQQYGNEGMYQAIHQGFELATGELITWINCDDLIIKKGYEMMYQTIDSDTKTDLIYSNGILRYTVENKDKIIKGRRFGKLLMKGGYIPFVQPSFICRKELYEAVGGFSYRQFKIIGDKDLFCRMARYSNSKFTYLNANSSIFLKHGNSLGDNNRELYLAEKTKSSEVKNLFYTFLRIFTKVLSKIDNHSR